MKARRIGIALALFIAAAIAAAVAVLPTKSVLTLDVA